ncbi:hypothetical protein B7463_g2859, partial [Scytalidium lignicola]
MASSSGRDDENRHDQNKSENPFIRFKQFADSQISALLQGIVGLPSAISRLPPVNTRWAEFDNELKRRDEAQEKQREAERSEVQVSARHADDGNETIIPVKKSWNRNSSTSNLPAPPNNQNAEDDITMDLPLYSPVTKSLFARLDPSDKTLDWGEGDQDHRMNFGLSFVFEHVPFSTQSDEQSSSIMKLVQSIAYNNLKSRTDLRSESSLLPYLLFSPYSPIKLSLESQSLYHETKSQSPPDHFPYQEAFEDLILTTQDRHMLRPLWPRMFHKNTFLDFPFFGSDIMRAGSAIVWIHKLNAYQLLEPLGPERQRNTQECARKEVRGTADISETEEDMYNNFLQGSEHPSPKEGVVFTHFKEDIDRQFRELEKASKEIRRLVGSGTATESDLDEFEYHGMLGAEIKKLEADLSAAKRRLERLTSDITPQTSDAADPDQVVATITTHDTRVRDDGTVETTVQVRRRYTDGRETITTKTSVGENDYEDTYTSSTKRDPEGDVKEDERKGKNKKKGWFWS